MKHTLGPWTYTEYWPYTWHIVGPENELITCHGFAATTGKRAKANAKLMTASPRMFEYIRARAKAGNEIAKTILREISE